MRPRLPRWSHGVSSLSGRGAWCRAGSAAPYSPAPRGEPRVLLGTGALRLRFFLLGIDIGVNFSGFPEHAGANANRLRKVRLLHHEVKGGAGDGYKRQNIGDGD